MPRVAYRGNEHRLAGAGNLSGKVLMDVSNPLEFSDGAPKLAIPAEGSVAEQLQHAFPGTRVVKTLQTMNNKVMVEPSRVPGPHNVFVCGDDPAAKAQVKELLGEFGWSDEQILDLGGLSAARQAEPLVMLWVTLAGVLNTMDFNYAILHG